MLRIYNVAAYLTVFGYLAACALIAPLRGDAWLGLEVGAGYFLFVWLLGGFYVGITLHLGLAHRSLDVAPWFIHAVALLANTLGVYVNPVTWCNRHRLHHIYSDHDGDPNKLERDGMLRTVWLMLFPYDSIKSLTIEPIFSSWSMRLVSNPVWAVLSQATSYGFLWLLTGDWKFALVPWAGMRLVSGYINLLQNYWTHDRRFGTRRYDDAHDHAMNVVNWLPIALSLSACLQNNHHHAPRFVRLSHDEREPDFGFGAVRVLRRLGIARPNASGLLVPAGANLSHPGID
jgi:sn-1 stearoyl-lipid 9-desaturase